MSKNVRWMWTYPPWVSRPMSSIDRLLRNVALLYVTRSSSSVDLELFVKLFIIRKFHFSYILGIHLPLLLLFRHLPLQQSFVVYGDRVPIHVVDPILLYSCHSSQKLNGWFLCCCCSLVVKFNDSPVGNSIGVTIIMIHRRRNHIPPPSGDLFAKRQNAIEYYSPWPWMFIYANHVFSVRRLPIYLVTIY